MNVQVVATTIGPDLTLWIGQIIQGYYSHDLYHYYETMINCYLQPNYINLVLYNTLEYPGYHLGMAVPTES